VICSSNNNAHVIIIIIIGHFGDVLPGKLLTVDEYFLSLKLFAAKHCPSVDVSVMQEQCSDDPKSCI